MKEIRQEFGLIACLVLLAFLCGWLFGNETVFLASAFGLYLGWHMVNILRLCHWLRVPRFRTPYSFGVWEIIFDRLQAINLRGRRRKHDLLNLARRFRRVVGGIADAVVLLDNRGRVRWFNPAAERLLGFRWPEASRASITNLLDHPLLLDTFNNSLDFRPAEIPSPVNGAIILRVEVTELHGTEQRLLIARDITKRRNLERLRKDFVANVSHELRTPLTVFRGYLETLADDIEQQPTLARPVTQLDQQATRMQKLVEDLLDLSRLEAGDLPLPGSPVCVSGLLDSVVNEVKGLEEAKEHAIILDVDPFVCLTGDIAILRMAFSNLVINAVKHTNRGTRVDVEWGRDKDGAVFRGRDDGQGIAAYQLPRLTERFYRVDRGRSREEGGTGLGLAIAKHALERQDAELQIESTPGRGTTFTCRFPAARVTGSKSDGPAEAGQVPI